MQSSSIQTTQEKVPVSALIGCYNETALLENCLKSLSFCDEILVVDLGTDDGSDPEAVARLHATSFERYHRVEIIEKIHPVFIPKLKHDWIILIDPDEVIRPALAEDIRRTIATAPDNISAFRVPMFNYFRGRKLEYSSYGGMYHARLLFNRKGIEISDQVHSNIQLKKGYDRMKIPFSGDNYDEHYWINSWGQLISKHRRYVKNEGKALYRQGKRYSLQQQLKASLISWYFSFKTRKAWKMGITGILLALMAGRYTWLSWSSLRRFQKALHNDAEYSQLHPKTSYLKRMLLKWKQQPDSDYEMHAFSQYGEDIVIRKLFSNKRNGFYVDIGAHHPRMLSNTYMFYKRGWRGINVDAQPGSMAPFHDLRPEDTNLELGVAATEGELAYYSFNDPVINTFSKDLADEYVNSNRNYKLEKVIPVKTMPLATLLDKYLAAGAQIDFLNVDCEGLDFEVLKSNDWSRYRPRLVIVEALEDDLPNIEQSEIYQLMKSIDYEIVALCYKSYFYKDKHQELS